MKIILRVCVVVLTLGLCQCTPDHILPIKGDIIGNVFLTGGNDQYYVDDNSNIRVRLEGIQPSIEVTTNMFGFWRMKDVPSGTYNIEYTREGYTSFKQFGFQHVGGSVPSVPYPDRLNLGEMPKTIVKEVKFVGPANKDNIVFNVSLSSSNTEDGVIAFLSRNGKATPTSYNCSTAGDFPSAGPNIIFHMYNLKSVYGFKTGDDVSMVVYAISSPRLSYYDPNHNVNIFTGLSETGVEYKFKIP